MKDDKEPGLREVSPAIPEPEPPSDCEFCSLLCRTQAGKGPSDPSSLHFMTDREIRILATMRRLKEEASRIKASMLEMEKEGKSGGESDLWARLADLKAQWKKMDKERLDAAEERMRRLGHIQ